LNTVELFKKFVKLADEVAAERDDYQIQLSSNDHTSGLLYQATNGKVFSLITLITDVPRLVFHAQREFTICGRKKFAVVVPLPDEAHESARAAFDHLCASKEDWSDGPHMKNTPDNAAMGKLAPHVLAALRTIEAEFERIKSEIRDAAEMESLVFEDSAAFLSLIENDTKKR